MNTVPRETIADAFSVQPLLFRKEMRQATHVGAKDTTRRLICEKNSRVHPGAFSGLDLETGRARRLELPELRARCRFESGRVRVVTVTSIVRPGDVFWVKTGRFGTRKASLLTLDVVSVDVGRVQDMTDADAMREGVEYLPPAWRRVGGPRDWFARLWDDINGKGCWAANPWVWIYKYATSHENIDVMLARWEARP